MQLESRYINKRVILPYGLTAQEVEAAVAETYRLFHGLNDYLVQSGFRPLEELLLGNSLSGIISEFLVRLSHLGFRYKPFYIRVFEDLVKWTISVKSMTREMQVAMHHRQWL